MADFHSCLPKLLKPGGVYSFFNGLAPDNLFFHMVMGRRVQSLSRAQAARWASRASLPLPAHPLARRLAQLELGALGLATSYERVAIEGALDASVWEGVRNKYWHLPFYFLPTCVFSPGEQGAQ